MKKTVATIAILLLLSAAAVFLVLGNASLHAAEIVYDGTTIRWNSVPFADYYTVSIDGGEPIRCEGTEYRYPNGGDFDVTVTVHKTIFSSDAEQKNFRYLQQVEGLQFSNGVLYWDAVFDADTYTVEINGIPAGEVTSCSFAYDGTQEAVFRIKPNSNNAVYYSVWSEAYSAYILPMPQNIVYDRETHTVSWDSVPYAKSYTVWVDGRYFDTEQTSYVYHAGTTAFNLQVQAIGAKEEHIFDSVRSQVQAYTYLAPVSNLRIQDGVLCWNGAPSATAYRIRVNGQEVASVAETCYTALQPAVKYTVQVLPKNENPYAYSDWQSLTFTVLETPVPGPLSVQSNQDVLFSWEPIEFADTYTLRIYRDGELVSTKKMTGCSFADPFTETGVYTVTVQSDATATHAQSALSEVATVIRLPSVTSHTVNEDGTVQFSPVAGASSYTVKVNSFVVADALTETSFALTDGMVKRNGETFKVTIIPNGTATGNSLLLDATDVYTFLVKKPELVSGVGVNENGVSWNLSAGASGYRVTVIRNATETIVTNVGATTNSLALDFSAAGRYQIKVQALCEDSQAQCIPSDSKTSKDVVRLEAPQIRLQHDDEALFWPKVEGATGYEVYVDGKKLSRPVYANNNPTFALGAYVTANERTVSLYAYGTSTATCLYLDSVPSETITFCRLGAPTSVKIDNENITWTAVPGATRYEIYIQPKNGEEQIKICKDGTVYNHSFAIGIGEHTVSVRAFSDDDKYLPAKRSGAVTVFRLPTPSISPERGKQTLTWNLPTAFDVPSGYAWSYISVSCNGQESRLEKTEKSYIPQNIEFAAYGDTSKQYLIQIQFVGSGDATVGKKGTISSFVDEYSFTAMKAPTPTAYINHRGGDNVTVGATVDKLPAGTTIRFECNGDVKTATAYTQVYQVSSAYAQYRVQLIGGGFDNNVFYGDSDWSAMGSFRLP